MPGLHGWTLLLALLAAPAAGHEGVISGRITHQKTNEPIPNALVILQCTCLVAQRETKTNAEGIYAFNGLPAGTYAVQVLVGQADVTKIVTLPPSPPEREP